VERELVRKQREEQRQREDQWERHTAQLKKRASTIDEKVVDSWLTHTYDAQIRRLLCAILLMF